MFPMATTYRSIFAMMCYFTSGVTLCSFGQSAIFSPKAGLTLSHSTLTDSKTSPHSTDRILKPGIMAGVGVELGGRKAISFQSGIFFIQKGSNSNHVIENDGTKVTEEMDIRLDYIEVPLLAKVLIKKFNN